MVLEAKAAATEAAVTVTELAMRTCGGAAFGGAHGLERLFRDARAPIVMAPTSDQALRVHRPGAVRHGGVLMARPLIVGAVMYDPKVSVIWEIIRDFFEPAGLPHRRVVLHHLRAAGRGPARPPIDIAWNSPLAWLDAQRRSGGTCRAIAMRDTDRDRVSHVVARRGRAPSARWPTCGPDPGPRRDATRRRRR